MRLLALLFFITTAPFVILLATISYGGISTTTIKNELSQSGLYKKIDFPPITSGYIKGKVDRAIDDSAYWITGKTENVPTISFKDIKEEFLAKNPDIQESFDDFSEIPSEVDSSDGNSTLEGNPQEFIKTLQENDFSYPLGDALAGLRLGHTIVSILLPALSILMVLSIIVIIIRSPDNKSRFRWVGITFLLSAIGGFILFHIAQFASVGLFTVLSKDASGMVAIILPIIERVAMLFIARQGEIQTLFSFAVGVFGVVCFASSFAFQGDAINKPQPKQKKKST